jgi:tRNA threonylcarbamoyladenosine biosynthesis protein TsaB
MLILAIDTSTRTGSAALLRDQNIIAETSGTAETASSARFFHDLSLLHSKTKFRMDQVDVFAVSSGPGLFSGLRVGLAAVKAFAEVYSKPIAAISSLEAIAVQSVALTNLRAPSVGPQSIVIAPFLDARRGQVFGSVYQFGTGNRAPLDRIRDDSLLSPDEFLEMAKETSTLGQCVLVSPTPALLPSALVQRVFPGATIEAVSPILAPFIGRLGFECASRGDLVDALRLDANYVRRSDAEAAWKDA